MQIDPDLHSTLVSNVILTGGTTLTQGFADRLQSELTQISNGMKLKIREISLSSRSLNLLKLSIYLSRCAIFTGREGILFMARRIDSCLPGNVPSGTSSSMLLSQLTDTHKHYSCGLEKMSTRRWARQWCIGGQSKSF